MGRIFGNTRMRAAWPDCSVFMLTSPIGRNLQTRNNVSTINLPRLSWYDFRSGVKRHCSIAGRSAAMSDLDDLIDKKLQGHGRWRSAIPPAGVMTTLRRGRQTAIDGNYRAGGESPGLRCQIQRDAGHFLGIAHAF